MFSTDSYSTVRGVDKLIPVDIYLPGCPPKPEAIIDAIIKLRKKVAQETYQDKYKFNQGERYLTLNHKFNFISTITTAQFNTQLDSQISKSQFESTLEIFASSKKKNIQNK
jgi:NAD(P)H-quinone oxidoreductase subunit K